jgi:PST family polysaccharide transporter
MERPVYGRIGALLFTSALRIGAILSGFGVLAFAILQTLEDWLGAIFNWLFFKSDRKVELRPQREYANVLLHECWPYLLGGLAVSAYTRVDQVMLGMMLDKRSVGVFSAAVSLTEALYFLPSAIRMVVLPLLTKLRLGDRSRYERVFAIYLNVSLFYSLLVALLMQFVAPFVIPLLFGHQFVESIRILQIHVLGFCFVASGTAQSAWYVNIHRGDILLKRTVAGLACNIGLNLFLIPRYGPVGAAWSTVVSFFVSSFGAALVLDRGLIVMQMRPIISLLRRKV